MTDEQSEQDQALVEALKEALGDRYRYVSRLGAGAFGEVYCLHDSVLERDVAVKRVRLDAFTEEAQRTELRERTIREAKVAAKLKHPNIVTIFDVVDRPSMCFIIMEYIDGQTLSQVLRERRRLTVEQTLEILSQTALALDFAHKKSVVHRDIKPANIMIESATGDVKVTDFGIAKADNFSELTAAGSVLGTPNYMSPEQARGESSVDFRADLFSLGCVLYECVLGQKAFVGKNAVATLMSIMNDPPRPVDYGALGLDESLSGIIDRALEKDPSRRFENAAALISAMRELPEAEIRDQPTVVLETPAGPPPETPVVTRRAPGSTSSFDAHLQGPISGTNAAEIIREIYGRRHTGILHLESEGVAKRIYFRKGNIVFANSDLDTDRLGEQLIRAKAIDRPAFERATETMRQTGHRLGATLIERELISRERLEELVREQVKEIVSSVFQWEHGSFGFEVLESPVEDDIVVDLSTAELILAGVRRMSSMEAIRDALGNLDRVIKHTENPLLLYQEMSLTTSEGFVHSRVDGATSIADIAAISPLGEDETLRCVYALVSSGVVELAARTVSIPTSRLDKRAMRDADLPKPDLGAPEKPESPKGRAAEKPSKTSKSPEPDASQQGILEEITAKHASLATANFYELLEVDTGATKAEIKQGYYKLAKKYHPDRHHLPHLRHLQGLLEELFAKMTAAHEALSDPETKRQYDERMGFGARKAKPAPKPEPPKPEAPAPYTVPPEVMAERRYQKALQHYQAMEYFDTIQCVRDSVRMMPADARYHKLLALALSKNPHWLEEAEFHFLEAMKVNEFDVECLLGLAESYEGRDLPAQAISMYERVLAYDPTNAAARDKLNTLTNKGKASG